MSSATLKWSCGAIGQRGKPKRVTRQQMPPPARPRFETVTELAGVNGAPVRVRAGWCTGDFGQRLERVRGPRVSARVQPTSET
jgi:hypothetical protein